LDWIWIAVAAVVVLYLWQRRRGMASGDEVAELQGRGATVLDVRSPGEYAGGHVEGAVNVPLDQVEARVARLVPGQDSPVLLYCRSGTRSGAARRKLQRLGYTCVHNVGSLSRARRLLSAGAASPSANHQH